MKIQILEPKEIQILEKGPKFSFLPKQVPVADLISSLESSVDKFYASISNPDKKKKNLHYLAKRFPYCSSCFCCLLWKGSVVFVTIFDPGMIGKNPKCDFSLFLRDWYGRRFKLFWEEEFGERFNLKT